MLADREDLNILDDDHLVVAFLEDGRVDDVHHVLLVAHCKVQEGIRISMRGGEEPFSVGILSHAFQQCPHSPLHALQPICLLLGALLQSCTRAHTGSAEPVEINHRTRRPTVPVVFFSSVAL